MSLLQMSVQGGVIVLVAAVLRCTVGKLLPRRTFLALWGVALARLLIPVSISSPFSAFNAAGHSTVLAARPVPVMAVQAETAAPAAAARHTPSVWALVWAFGTVLLAAYFISGYIYFRCKFRFSLPVTDGFALEYLQSQRLCRKVRLYQSGLASVPMTYGVLHPVILLPKGMSWSDQGHIRCVLTHEITHIRHFDTFWKMVSAAALCLHWFNPLVWLMCVLFARDTELFCDECTVQQLGGDSRQDYAMALIRMEEQKSGLYPFSSGFGRNATEERIWSIMRLKKTSLAALFAAVLLVMGVTAAFATSAEGSKMAPRDALMVQRFQFYGWESMSVAAFRERAETLLDEPEVHEWWLDIEKNSEYYDLQDADPLCEFLYHVLNELTAERWQSRDHGGAIVKSVPRPFDPAMFEYFFRMEILDPERLTVSEYHKAMHGVWDDMGKVLETPSYEQCQDSRYMRRYLSDEGKKVCDKWSSDALHIEMISISYHPSNEEGQQPDAGLDTEKLPDSLDAEPAEQLQGRTSNTDLDSYTESEPSGVSVVVKDDGSGRREADAVRGWPPAAKADYESVLQLKVPGYKDMTLDKFNASVLEWSNENYERAERIACSAGYGEVNSAEGLTDEEREFIALTWLASGCENGEMVRSYYTGRLKDPVMNGSSCSASYSEPGIRDAWCGLWYQFSYHIEDKSGVTVGERDRCVGGFVRSVQEFWQAADVDTLLEMDKGGMVRKLQELAEQNSTGKVRIQVSTDMVSYETMDELLAD